LKNIKLEDIKNDSKKFTKNIIDGELCKITGHLIESDNNLGISLVIDLNAS
jgi:hypothetical protein